MEPLAAGENTHCEIGHQRMVAVTTICAVQGISVSTQMVPMKKKAINRILKIALAAAPLLLLSACGAALDEHRPVVSQADCGGLACIGDESRTRVALLSNDVSTPSGNNYLDQCGEQARMTHHEVQNCRAITVLTVPLD